MLKENTSMLLSASKISLISVFMLIFVAIFQPSLSYAEPDEDAPAYKKKLNRLQQSILKVQDYLKESRSHRGHTLTELRKLESDISLNARSLKKTEKKVRTINVRIKTLKKSLKQLTRKLKSQRFILGEQLRAAYAVGSQQNIKILLNQQDPAEMGRIQAYFDYLNRARETQIQQFIQSIESKQQQEQALSENLSAQKTALQTRKKQKRTLQKQRIKRNQLLAQLNEKIQNQEQTLSGLESSRNKIEGLLRSLGQLLADIPATSSEKKPFKQQQNILPWPIQGKFLSRFGQSRNQGDLKWNGVLISSSYGKPVQAISHGRIAFSDWLQGYGFIIIIDHGDGYMSLYGHNESLFKQTGDWILAGDVIATTGDSGGQPKPGLYFEIRVRGKPVDPFLWCSDKIAHNAAL